MAAMEVGDDMSMRLQLVFWMVVVGLTTYYISDLWTEARWDAEYAEKLERRRETYPDSEYIIIPKGDYPGDTISIDPNAGYWGENLAL